MTEPGRPSFGRGPVSSVHTRREALLIQTCDTAPGPNVGAIIPRTIKRQITISTTIHSAQRNHGLVGQSKCTVKRRGQLMENYRTGTGYSWTTREGSILRVGCQPKPAYAEHLRVEPVWIRRSCCRTGPTPQGMPAPATTGKSSEVSRATQSEYSRDCPETLHGQNVRHSVCWTTGCACNDRDRTKHARVNLLVRRIEGLTYLRLRKDPMVSTGSGKGPVKPQYERSLSR